MLIFLHIPRTGGSTLHWILRRQFQADETLAIVKGYDPWAEIASLPQSHRMQIKYVWGHLYYGIHQYFAQPATYITFMRDPVDRIISHYHFVRSHPNHYLHQAVVSGNMSLKDYITSDLSSELINGQTRMISGLLATEELTEQSLVLAKANIERHFSFVGLMERYDESLVIARRLFGWHNVYYVRKNVSRGRQSKQDVPQDVLDIIARRNQLDIELYQFVRERFDQAIEAYGPAFRADVIRFQALNALFRALYTGYKTVSSPFHSVRNQLRRAGAS